MPPVLGGKGLDLTLDGGDGPRHLGHVGSVAGIAGGPGDGSDECDAGGTGVGAPAEPQPAALQARVQPGEPSLLEDHFPQQPGDEEALCGPGKGRRSLPPQAEAGGDGPQHPVDGRTGLGAAGEIDAPHQGSALKAVGGEGRVQKLRQGFA